MLLRALIGGTESLARLLGSWRISQTPGLLWSGNTSAAGVDVTEEGALSLSGVFAAVNLLSRLTGSLPLHVFRRDGRRKGHARDLPVYRALHTQANPEMTASVARTVVDFFRLLWGNGYAEIGWRGDGSPESYWPLEAWRVRPRRRADGSLYYRVDGERDVEPGDMLHVPLMSYDGVCGRSFVDYACESLGLALATQQHAGSYFGNGARPGVILEHPGNPSPEQRREMREGWEGRHQGPRKSGRTGVMWGGWKFVALDGSFDPEKSQLLEQRRFGVEEVARWLNLPPHLLRDLSRATFSNIEQQGIDFINFSIGPPLVNYEQEYDRKLLGGDPDLFTRHDLAGLTRGDRQARGEYNAKMFAIGARTINEIRDEDDLNPVEGGDTHFVPANLFTLERAVAEGETVPGDAPVPPPGEDAPPEGPPADVPEDDPEDPASGGERNNALRAVRGLLASTLARLAKVEANAVRRAAKRPERFLAWMDEFYPKHEANLEEAVGPVLLSAGLLGLAAGPDAARLAGEWCRGSRDELLSAAGVASPAALPVALDAFLCGLEDDRPRAWAESAWGAGA